MALGDTVVGRTVIDSPGIDSPVGAVTAAAPVVPAARASTETARPDGTSTGQAPAPPGRCRCGHDAAAHEHFRSGTDCGACGAQQCGRFRPATARRGLLRALAGALRRRAG